MSISIYNTRTAGWESAITAMRKPLNSCDKSDSGMRDDNYVIGPDDMHLMQKLASGGDDDSKHMRMVVIWAEINAPLYWWKQYDTYKIGTVAESSSTMHTIHKRDLTLNNFAQPTTSLMTLVDIINECNFLRKQFIETGDKSYWDDLIKLLPESFMQDRSVMLNYQAVKHMYDARKNHKLDEWHHFCTWALKLPYFKDIYQIDDEVIRYEGC